MKHIATIRRRGFTQVELAVLLGITGLFGVQIIPAINDAREAARRTQCKDNLHNIGLAMHNYSDVHAMFPPGWIQHSRGPDEGMGFGWAVEILPFVDEARLYLEIDFEAEPTADGVPRALFEPLNLYHCPSDDSADLNNARGGWPTSNYVGNYGSVPPPRWSLVPNHGFWPGEDESRAETSGVMMCNRGIGFGELFDGASNTFLAGERASSQFAAIWIGVRSNRHEADIVASCSWDAALNESSHGFSSRHPNGSQFMFCDGAVRFISMEIDQLTYERLASRHDGGAIPDLNQFSN